jgi:hypothetical protein
LACAYAQGKSQVKEDISLGLKTKEVRSLEGPLLWQKRRTLYEEELRELLHLNAHGTQGGYELCAVYMPGNKTLCLKMVSKSKLNTHRWINCLAKARESC